MSVEVYEEGETVLVLSDNFYYLAIIKEIREENGKKLYYVKYRRFSNAYNEDVTIDRMKKATKEAIEIEEQKKKDFEEQMKKNKKAKTGSNKVVTTKTTEKSTAKTKAKTQDIQSTTTVPSTSIQPTSKKQTKSQQNKIPMDIPQTTFSDNTLLSTYNSTLIPHTLSLKISPILRKIIWEDFESAELRRSVYKLPCRPCVSQIIADYLSYLYYSLTHSKNKKQKTKDNESMSQAPPSQDELENSQTPQDKSMSDPIETSLMSLPPLPQNKSVVLDQATDILLGIRAIFDACFSTTLLHKFEYEQYISLNVDNNESFTPSTVYGFEHFLRLFIKLPVLLFSQNLTTTELAAIEYHLNQFLIWLTSNYKRYQSSRL